jgi:hypothetical protein
MVPISELELVGRLVLATLLGFLIGLELEFVGQYVDLKPTASGAIGFLPQSTCKPRSSSLMNTLAVICIAYTRDNTLFHTCRFRSPDGGDDCGLGVCSAELQRAGGVTGSEMSLNWRGVPRPGVALPITGDERRPNTT